MSKTTVDHCSENLSSPRIWAGGGACWLRCQKKVNGRAGGKRNWRDKEKTGRRTKATDSIKQMYKMYPLHPANSNRLVVSDEKTVSPKRFVLVLLLDIFKIR